VRALRRPMRFAWVGVLVLGGFVCGGGLQAGSQDSEFNVNNRYTVDSVFLHAEGASTDMAAARDERISSPLRKDILAIIGEKLNPAILDDLARRLRKDMHARAVDHHILRGKTPECVEVVFDVEVQPARFDVAVPKFLYQARQGWSGAVEGTAIWKHQSLTAGLVSDGDELAERYTGITARYQNTSLGTPLVHFSFDYGTLHEQWNGSTVDGLATARTAGDPLATSSASDLYRTRQYFEPVVSFRVLKPLTVSVGASFESFQDETPEGRIESANAALASVRYQDQVEGSDLLQNIDAGYDVRMGTRALRSDMVYARHHWEFRYTLTRGKQVLIEEAMAGMIVGQAPLYERFILGNSSTLRGWNKYEIDPFGGNRMIHNTVEYRYGAFQVFYDSGAIWESGQTADGRNSVGVGVRQGPFMACVGFPLREGHIDPIFMVGMNY